MTAHDSWVFLKTGTPFDTLKELFPEGFPVRDPFAAEIEMCEGLPAPLWVIDRDRLLPEQTVYLVKHIVINFDESHPILKAAESGRLLLHGFWVEKLVVGREGHQRSLELEEFKWKMCGKPTETRKVAKWEEFVDDQRRRWIDGNEEPPPLKKQSPRNRMIEFSSTMFFDAVYLEVRPEQGIDNE
jgi:hypothetical protein